MNTPQRTYNNECWWVLFKLSTEKNTPKIKYLVLKFNLIIIIKRFFPKNAKNQKT